MEDDDPNGSPSRPSTAHRVEPHDTSDMPTDNPSSTPPDTPPQPTRNNEPSSPDRQPPADSILETTFTGAQPEDSRLDPSFYEQDLHEHLGDVESSFHVPLSPLTATNPAPGLDDTYLFDAAPRRRSPLAQSPSPNLPPLPRSPSPRTTPPEKKKFAPLNAPNLPPPTYAQDESTAEPQESSTADISNTTSSLENLSSSPTAAAAARTISRAISSASARSQASQANEGPDTSASEDLQSSHDSYQSTDSLLVPHALLSRQRSTPSPTKLSVGEGGSMHSERRPKYLRSRNASQRSSTSSFTNPSERGDAESDVTVGMAGDYAQQPSGSVPASGVPRSLSFLSRSISIGSMASGIDEPYEGSASKGLETLDEDNAYPQEGQGQGNGEGGGDMLQTPRPAKGPPRALTDTVIARHVQNVHVPESLAKEYKFKSGLTTPHRRSELATTLNTPAPFTSSRGGKNLTLKEQSSTIERLSKENFDLKLKVMFLSDRLDKLSEEGVREMISENVELKTSLAVIQRENKALRRRVKDLEKQIREEDERPSTARSGTSSADQSTHEMDDAAREREEELYYLRERVEEYATEIERLRHENLGKENDKRKLGEMVRAMGESRAGEGLGRQDETDVWKDLLEQETARREQSDEDNRRLREEIFRLKQDLAAASTAAPSGGAPAGMHHTTNIYNITKKHRVGSPSRPVSGLSGEMVESASGNLSTATTLLEDLRRESEQLRHENAELRREVGAQTSMLTSRNREKERLYQEIEDLKMAQRRGGGPAPSTVDTLLERSASRAGVHHQQHHEHQRSLSRASGTTRQTGLTDDEAEREELENQNSELRDRINEVKLLNQELQQELDQCMQDFESAIEARQQTEELAGALQQDLETAMNDLVALQAERDEALREQAEMENEFEALRKEAQAEIDALEGEVDQRSEEAHRLQLDLHDRSENFEALQEEMRRMSDALLRLEDEQDAKLRKIGQLEQELSQANRELEELESKLSEANDKAGRLGVQQESSQGEIAFLREEQEADKIRIGNLEAELAGAEQSLRDEKERVREVEARLQGERKQREIVAGREKEEVQAFVNELNREASGAKDEARRLRKALGSREVEAAEWKERLMELEGNLRVALGDLNGTRSSLLNSISALQRQLEDTVRELDAAKADIGEKDRAIKQRDGLLESQALEARRIAELLEKERQAHRTTRSQFETFQKTHQHVSVTAATQETRIQELEASRAQAVKKLVTLENTFKDQLTERNNLLLVLWSRLSAVCGSDWAHDNSLINGRALPSLEALGTMLPGFSKNLLAAVKTIEGMVGSFQSRIKGVERELWREYQSLENNLEVRTKKLDRLESMVRNGIASGSIASGGRARAEEAAKARYDALEEAYRQLKVENATLRTANDVRARAAGTDAATSAVADAISGSPSPSIPTGPRDRERSMSRKGVYTSTARAASMLSRGASSSSLSTAAANAAVNAAGKEVVPNAGSDGAGSGGEGGSGGGSAADKALLLRFREMERKLHAEREGRVQDRSAARKRLWELEMQNRDLRGEVSRIKRASSEGPPRE